MEGSDQTENSKSKPKTTTTKEITPHDPTSLLKTKAELPPRHPEPGGGAVEDTDWSRDTCGPAWSPLSRFWDLSSLLCCELSVLLSN